MDESEIRQIISDCYEQTFDLDLAYQKAGCTPEQIAILNADESFQKSLQYFLILEKEKIVRAYRTAMLDKDPKIAFAAAKEMGRVIYPEFFNREEKEPKNPISVIVDMPFEDLSVEEQERVRTEFNEIRGVNKVR